MLRTSLATAVAVLLLAACGAESGTTATDPATPSEPVSTGPTDEPTVGTYPPFEPEDYTYQLSVTCFCLAPGVPIEVTVEDAQVVGAVYLADDGGRGGVKQGDPADQSRWLTINDVIDAANDTGAAQVVVDWPAGQDYPNSVNVDQALSTVDEEIGYRVSSVRIG